MIVVYVLWWPLEVLLLIAIEEIDRVHIYELDLDDSFNTLCIKMNLK